MNDYRMPTIKEANAALRFAQRMNRLRIEAEGRAYHAWLDERVGIHRPNQATKGDGL